MISTNKTSPIINKETIKISNFFSNSIIKNCTLTALGKVGIRRTKAHQKSGIMTYFMTMESLFQKKGLDLLKK